MKHKIFAYIYCAPLAGSGRERFLRACPEVREEVEVRKTEVRGKHRAEHGTNIPRDRPGR